MNTTRTLIAVALCLGLSLLLSSRASAQNQGYERQRSALRRQFLAAKDVKTKRALLKRMRNLSPYSAATRTPATKKTSRGEGSKRGKNTKRGKRAKQGRSAKRRRSAPRRSRARALEKTYQVKLQGGGADAVRKDHPWAPKSLKDEVRDKPWTAKELVLIEDSLKLLDPLLSAKDTLDRISRVNATISEEPGDVFTLDDEVMGQWFGKTNSLVLTDKANQGLDFEGDPDWQFKGTLIHEVAHGVLGNYDPRTGTKYSDANKNPVVREWREATGWRRRGITHDPKRELPPTKYARQSSNEDLSESTMLFLLEPAKFKAEFPVRHAFLSRLFADAKAYKATLETTAK